MSIPQWPYWIHAAEHNDRVRLGLSVFEYPNGERRYGEEQLRDERTPDELRAAAVGRDTGRKIRDGGPVPTPAETILAIAAAVLVVLVCLLAVPG